MPTAGRAGGGRPTLTCAGATQCGAVVTLNACLGLRELDGLRMGWAWLG